MQILRRHSWNLCMFVLNFLSYCKVIFQSLGVVVIAYVQVYTDVSLERVDIISRNFSIFYHIMVYQMDHQKSSWVYVWLFWVSLEKEEMVYIILLCYKPTTFLINCCYQNLSFLLRVRSVPFTSRAKGCIKFVPHSCLVSLSDKVGLFLEEAICYFIYAKFAVMLGF